MNHPWGRSRWRRLRAGWRDTLLLFREFRTPLLLFTAAIGGSGLLYDALARRAATPTASVVEAIYVVLSLTFLQSIGEFPRAWYLQIFHFVMPVVGIGILAQGLTDFGVLLFNRKARSKEWEMAVASTFKDHCILVGIGHLGYRVVQILHAMEQQIVVIERHPSDDLLTNVRKLDIPILEGDGTREAILEAAGVRRARTIMLCTQNDSLNLQMAVKARGMNPDIHVVVRIFDDDFANALEGQFGYRALSATGMAAPAFASAAAGVDITRPITVEGQALSLARLNIGPKSGLVGRQVGAIETGYEVSVVLLRRLSLSDLHPSSDIRLEPGDVLAVLGGPDQISTLVHDNRDERIL